MKEKTMVITAYVLLCGLTVTSAVTPSIHTVKSLKQKVFDGYDRLLRPVLRHEDVVEVNLTLNLDQIDHLDLKAQKLKWKGWLTLTWYDQLITWNASEYGDIDYICLPQTEIWLPDYVIANDVVSTRTVGSQDTLLVIKSTGQVIWEPGIITETSCKIDISKYPFDEQSCTFVITPWVTMSSHLTSRSLPPAINYVGFISHGEYTLTQSYAVPSAYYVQSLNDTLSGITFVQQLKRRTTFYWMNVLFPMMAFAFLCPISFLVPVECGEKLTLSITSVLSYFVFIGTVNAALPNLSDNVSLLLVYCSSQTAIAMFAVVANGIIICVSKLSPHRQIPFQGLVHFLRANQSKTKENTNPPAVTSTPDFLNLGNLVSKSVEVSTRKRLDDYVSRSVEEHGIRQLENHVLKSAEGLNIEIVGEPASRSVEGEYIKRLEDHATKDWEGPPEMKYQKVARRLDNICFVLFSVLTVTVTLAFGYILLI